MKKVLLFALPIILGNVLQQMYTTVDTLVIGKYCGDASLAAVGTSSQPVEVLLCIFLGIGSGVSILVSQYAGAGNLEKVKRTCDTAVTFMFMCGIPLGFVGLFATPLILKLMGVPQDAWSAAVSYTRIVFLGSLGNIGYNMNAGILRGLGDSKASLWFLVVSCVVNIVLDLVFVAGFGMDVTGAALSTIIAMYLSWLVSILYIRKCFPTLGYTFLPRHFYKDEIKSVISIGLPIGLNHSLYSLGHMALQTLVAGLAIIAVRMPVLRCFPKEPAVLMYASRYVVILLLSQWVYAIFNAIISVVNGVGLIRYTIVVNLLMLWAVRIPSAYLIAKLFDGTFVMLCFPISFSFGLIMMLAYYAFSRKWKEIIRTGL